MKNRDIYLMYQSKEFVVSRYTLKTIDEVANFLGTAPYFVERVLEGKTIKGNKWKPNIFYKNIEGGQLRFIVVYKDYWDNYSEQKKNNRIDKIIT